MRSKKTKDRLFTVILGAAMAIGICLLAYPSLSDYWNSFHQTEAVMTYAENVANMNTEDYERILDDARAYNSRISESGINWRFSAEKDPEYEKQLNLEGTGVMGYIRIQKINVMLPIYHGTDEEVLKTSIGHMESSSLPVGGESSHCVLSGHRGLPNAKLFTDIDRLREGDTFTMTIMNETLTYEVDHILIVEPDDFTHLHIEEGKDLCTLVTCTPYGINSHRLLVRGHRIDNMNGNATIVADAIQIQPVHIAPFIAIPILLLLLAYVLVTTGSKNRNRRDYMQEYMNENELKEVEIPVEDQDLIIAKIRGIIGKKT